MKNFIQLNEEEKVSVLELVKTFLKSRKTDFKRQSLEEYNRELDQADDEIEAGEYVPHEEVMKRHFK
ncbi:MAG: hypothetical protein ABIW47_01775 [Ginsengibacter sp.]